MRVFLLCVCLVLAFAVNDALPQKNALLMRFKDRRGGASANELLQSGSETDVHESPALNPEVPKTESGNYPANDTPDTSQNSVLEGAKCTKTKCNVLVVVDMQKDYCKGCGSATESKWASEGVLNLAPKINLVLDQGANFDLVVFTKDWLDDAATFLKHDTDGAEVMTQLTPRPAGKTYYFTKRADDWLNHGYWNGRQFAIKGEVGLAPHESKPTPLDQILISMGYLPKKTALYVTGTATYRCVMKGSVHARALGYEVNVVEDAVEGDGDKGDWDRYTVDGKPADSSKALEWMISVFSTRGGPDVTKRKSIFKNAGVLSCANAEAVKNSLAGTTPCPLSSE